MLPLLGILGMYCEFIWPGRIVPGLSGAAAVVCGCYFLSQYTLSGLGLALICIAAAFFIAEAVYRTYFLAGTMAMVCLAIGGCKLIYSGPGIRAGVAIPVSIVFGGVTIFLGSAAKRATRNKRSDI